MTVGTPIALNLDRSVYYQLRDGLRARGWITPSGTDIVYLLDGDLEDFLAQQEEAGQDISVPDNVVPLPAVTYEMVDKVLEPGALGGWHWHNPAYELNVYGRNKTESRQLAETIEFIFASGLYVYDYTLGAPEVSGFPLSGQYLGTWDVQNLRNRQITVPSYSVIDRVRREVSFEVVSLGV